MHVSPGSNEMLICQLPGKFEPIFRLYQISLFEAGRCSFSCSFHRFDYLFDKINILMNLCITLLIQKNMLSLSTRTQIFE